MESHEHRKWTNFPHSSRQTCTRPSADRLLYDPADLQSNTRLSSARPSATMDTPPRLGSPAPSTPTSPSSDEHEIAPVPSSQRPSITSAQRRLAVRREVRPSARPGRPAPLVAEGQAASNVIQRAKEELVDEHVVAKFRSGAPTQVVASVLFGLTDRIRLW